MSSRSWARLPKRWQPDETGGSAISAIRHHACDRGAVRLDPCASRSQAYQPDPGVGHPIGSCASHTDHPCLRGSGRLSQQSGGSGVHVEAVAITERERGTSEAPGGRVVQATCPEGAWRDGDGDETTGSRAGWTGLPARNLRACRAEISARPGSRRQRLAGAAQGEDHCRLAVHGRFSREGRRRDRPRRTPPPGRPGQRGARPARTRGPAAGGAGPGR
jgi:hypothetical protein